jgi:hypothetical protein
VSYSEILDLAEKNPGTNTLAYFPHQKRQKVYDFYNKVVNAIKTFTTVSNAMA